MNTLVPHRQSERGYSMIELLVVVGVVGVITAMAVSTSLGTARLLGDARGIKNQVSLSRMQAAANFTKARLYVDLIARTYRIETWRSTGVPAWVTQGGTTYLSSTAVYGFGPVGTPPPNTQAGIAQAPPCLDAAGAAIANTACILFNSRGIPVDTNGAPTAVYAIYVTDGTAVFGTTVSATSIVQLWRTNPSATPTWVLQ
jgi:prepilin-type N-terminal cleavage/methylation domain-containing protein